MSVTKLAEKNSLELYPIIDTDDLAAKWKVKPCWVRNHVQPDSDDPIPHLKLGKYVRFQWGHPELIRWLQRRVR
jgi:hypothetical protein